MKRLIFSIAAIITFSAVNAQTVKIYKNGAVSAEVTDADSVVFSETKGGPVDQAKLCKTFTERVVEPTYRDMITGNTALLTTIKKFVANPTQDNMDDCADAWLNARAPWERSEAYLFGPVEDFNVDPNIDSWPLEVGSITQIMQQANWSALEGDDESSQEIKGYHTLEYLIFNEGQARNIATDAYYKANPTNWGIYMQKVAEMLVSETQTLYNKWFVTGDEQYGGLFKTYFCGDTYQNPLGEMIEGCSGIAEEVGNSKIGGPYEQAATDPEGAVYQVESWYSWHSRDDYMNNIRGIRFTYIGERSNNYNDYAANSLRALVLEKMGADYDKKVTEAIDAAIDAINNIPQPFRSHIRCTEVYDAMQKCAKLKEVLDDMQADLGLN